MFDGRANEEIYRKWQISDATLIHFRNEEEGKACMITPTMTEPPINFLSVCPREENQWVAPV